MTRLLTTTAIGLLMGFTPALAQSDMPADQTQTPPAVEEPAMPSEVAPVDPGEPAQPIPDNSAEAQPAPGNSSDIPDESAEVPSIPDMSTDIPESAEAPDAEMPSGTAETLPETVPDDSVTEAPKSILPEDQQDLGSDSASIQTPQFLDRQEPGDWLASNLIGQPVVNSNDEAIGDINDLVTDENGKVIAVLIGAGGFLGLGEKDVAVRFEDLRYTRDEDNNVKVVANLSNEILASAPDYETLAEQEMTVGAADDDDAIDDDAIDQEPTH